MRESGKEEQNKKIRTESGQIVNSKKRKNLYLFNNVSICARVAVFILIFSPFSCIIEKLMSLDNLSVMRNGRRNTKLMMQDLV